MLEMTHSLVKWMIVKLLKWKERAFTFTETRHEMLVMWVAENAAAERAFFQIQTHIRDALLPGARRQLMLATSCGTPCLSLSILAIESGGEPKQQKAGLSWGGSQERPISKCF